MAADVRAHAAELRAAGVPFVFATVVRAQRPTSAKPGDHAVVHADGTIVGFVGGECAQASVRARAIAALDAGEPVLLRIVPDDVSSGRAAHDDDVLHDDAVVTVHNPCLSGGTLEVFLEPTMPSRRVVVHGHSPIGEALVSLARHLGYVVDDRIADDGGRAADVVVVASHGEDEAKPLVGAVRAGVPYVGLVASRRRGPQVVAALELTDDEKARIHTPAGLDIGARRPDDVAISIMAEAIAARSRAGVPPSALDVGVPEPRAAGIAVDPVCGMTVAALDATPHADVAGVRYWFCGSACRDAFTADPAAFASR